MLHNSYCWQLELGDFVICFCSLCNVSLIATLVKQGTGISGHLSVLFVISDTGVVVSLHFFCSFLTQVKETLQREKNLLWKQKPVSERGDRKNSNYVTENRHTVQIREGGRPDGCLFDSLSINLVPAEKQRANLDKE